MSIVSALFAGLLLTTAAGADSTQALAPVVVPLPPPADLSKPSERDATGAISVVHARGKSGEHVDTAQLIRALPGLTVRESSGVGQAQLISVRGAEAQGVRVELDGIPLNGAGGIADLSTVPLAFVDTVELARGASGARYGFGALGGVLEIETLQPDDSPRVAARLTGGSFGTALMDLSATGPLLGGTGLLLVHGQRTAGDFAFPFDPLPSYPGNPLETRVRENNGSKLGGGLLELRRRFGDWDAEALADLTTLSRGLAGTAVSPTPGLSEALTRWLLGVRAHRDLGGAELFLRSWGNLEGSELDTPQLPALRQTFDTAGAEATLRAFAGDHLLQATLEAGGEWLFGTGSYRRGRFALMAGDDWLVLGRLTLSGSLRYQRIGSLDGLSPKLGAALALPRGFSLRANAGLTFRAPSFLELYVVQGTLRPNPELRPEKGRAIDAAIAWDGPHGRASLGGFATDYVDLIRYELYAPFLAAPRNFDGARVWGLELEAGFHRGLVDASASYTLTRSADLRDDVRYFGKELPYEPRHQLEARLSLGTDRLKGTAELTARSRQSTNRAQTMWIDPSARLDLSGSVQLSRAPKVSLVLLFENVFDTQTLAFDGYPLPGRAIYATVEVALGGEGKHL